MAENVIQNSVQRIQGGIDYANVHDETIRRLSLLGKRLKDGQGNTLFASVTKTSAEDNVWRDYVMAAGRIFIADFEPLVEIHQEDDGNVNLVFSNKDLDKNKVNIFLENFESYAVAYIVREMLYPTYAELAKVYEVEMQEHLKSAIRAIYCKKAPTVSGKRWGDMQGGISFDNIEDNVQLI